MLLVVAFCAGCPTPYQTTMGFTGGTKATPVGNNVYVIRSAVNGYTSQGTAIEYAYRRAGEVCPRGFQVADSAATQKSSWWRTSQYSVQRIDKPEVTLVVQCNAAPPPQVAEPTPSPTSGPLGAAAAGPSLWWCTYLPGTLAGHCDRSQDGCDRMRSSMTNAGYSLADCYEQQEAFCYNESSPQGIVVPMCEPTMQSCEFAHDGSKGVVLSACAGTH